MGQVRPYIGALDGPSSIFFNRYFATRSTYNSMLKLSVLDVLFGGGVAVSSDPAPDSAIAPSCFGGVQVISRIRGN